ncbi:MAG: PaaI family thioesterase [Planctomycetota bacterium]
MYIIFPMSKTIPNVFNTIPGYCCFGCSPDNDIGLRLAFFAEEDGTCWTEYAPKELHSGFPGILHGGIASTVLDELAFWAVFNATGRFGLTARLNLKYRSAVPVGARLRAEGMMLSRKGKICTLSVRLVDPESKEVYVEGDSTYIIVDRATWERVTGSPVHSSIQQYFEG